MNRSPLSICLGICCVVITATCALAAPPSANERMIVLTSDMTKDGLAVTPPDRDHPVYYMPVFEPYEEKGPPTKAWERKPDNEPDLRAQIGAALAQQGYLPTTKEHAPSLVIAFEWGSIAPNKVRVGRKGGEILNADEMRATVLGDRAPEAIGNFNVFGAYTRDMTTFIPRHYLIISGFRYQPGPHQGEVLLWRVHTTSSLWGNYLQEVMPQFIATAAPAAGRSTAPGAVWIPRVARVVVGEPKVKAMPAESSPK